MPRVTQALTEEQLVIIKARLKEIEGMQCHYVVDWANDTMDELPFLYED